jgi:hypothetical protein
LEPQVVDVHVIFDGDLLAEHRERWVAEIAVAARSTGIKGLVVSTPIFHDIAKMRVTTYRDSVPVNLPLSGQAYW